MSTLLQGILITLVNTTLILGVFLWSGKVTEKTLYNRYSISFESVSLAVKSTQKTSDFYSRVLNFTPLTSEDGTIKRHVLGFELPGHKALYFHAKKSSSVPEGHQSNMTKTAAIALVIKVKNGFEKFHKELLNRSGHDPVPLSEEDFLQMATPGRISQIFRGSYGDQFVASDPEGNLILFYRKRKLRL